MKIASENPNANVLASGVSDEMVKLAVQASGYPLQLVVAELLSKDFSLEEEWSFVDPESGSTRTVDLLASQFLFEWREPQPRVRPELNFVVECKQSDLPYIFFLSRGHPSLPDFPIISGLKTRKIVLTTDDDPSRWTLRLLHALELDRHPFLTKSVPFCMTFSKCVRKGSELVLSGSDPYQSLVFPIIKAVSYFDQVESPPSTAHYFDCHVVIGLAILDAPMVGVRLTDSGNEMELLPWVRIVRHQPSIDAKPFDRSQVLGIDVVHKDYLRTYVDQHVSPFAKEFSALALKHADEIADGRGFVPSMGENSWTEIERRLQRTTFETRGKRFQAILEQITRLFKKPE